MLPDTKVFGGVGDYWSLNKNAKYLEAVSADDTPGDAGVRSVNVEILTPLCSGNVLSIHHFCDLSHQIRHIIGNCGLTAGNHSASYAAGCRLES